MRQRTLERRPDESSDDDVMLSTPSDKPSLPKLKPPPDPGRMAPTLLDFRMPSDMLAELSKLKPGAPASNDGPADEAAGAPTVDETPPEPEAEGGSVDGPDHSAAASPPEPGEPAEQPSVVEPRRPDLPLPAVAAPPQGIAQPGPDGDGPATDPGSAGPSTIVELPPVMLVTEPPVPSPPPVPVEPEQAEPGAVPASAPPAAAPVSAPPVAAPVSAPPVAAPVSAPPVAAPVSAPPVVAPASAPPVAAPVSAPPVVAPASAPPVAAPVSAPPVVAPASAPPIAVPVSGLTTGKVAAEPPDTSELGADAAAPDESLPPPAPDDGDEVVLLGEPVVEPDPFAVDASGDRAAGEGPSGPDDSAGAELPLPGTDRIVPAEEIAIRSRPPQPQDAEPEGGELARTMRSIALSDIAKALREEASAADRAEEGSRPPAATSPQLADEDDEQPDESMDGFDGLDLDGLAAGSPAGAAEDDGFQDLVEPALEAEPSGEGPAPEPDLELIEDASMPPPPAAAVELVAEALESDAPGAVLSTDELEEVRPGGPPPVPVPAAPARLVLRVMNREVGDDVVVELASAPAVIGSGDVDLSVEDAWLSARHARVAARDGLVQVEDLDSLNGVWLRVQRGARLSAGDRFIIGRQVCEIARDATAPGPRVVDGVRRLGGGNPAGDLVLRVLGTDGRISRSVRLGSQALRLGRHLGEVVFTGDSHLSATHAVVRADGGQVRLDDLGSRNGTWVRLKGPCSLKPGDSFLTGRTVWRVGTAVR